MECLLWQLADLSDQSRKDYQIQNSKNQRRLVGPNRESLHHHPQQPSQPRQRQWPDRHTPHHRPKAHPLETQKTPSVRPGTNRSHLPCRTPKLQTRAASGRLRAPHEDLRFPGQRNAPPQVVRPRLGHETTDHRFRWPHQKP